MELVGSAIIDEFKVEMNNMSLLDDLDKKIISDKLDVIGNRNSERSDAINAAKWLWKEFIKAALKKVTKNIRGYYELCEYYDTFAEYENLLFALDDNHRDHIIHSIWVLLLGIHFKKECEVFTNNTDFGLVHYVGDDEKESEGYKKTLEKLKELDNELWFLIALTHDLGYPIEKTKKANAVMAGMIKSFGFLEISEFKYNFSIVHETAIELLLNTIAGMILWGPNSYKLLVNPGLKLDYAKSFEKLDHGIMSAYLLLKYLDVLCLLINPQVFTSGKSEAIYELAFASNWLYSIASHSNEYSYHSDISGHDVLLFVCDELDEFSRYGQSINSKNWVRSYCRTEFECSNGTISFIYTFDDPKFEVGIKDFFKFKLKNVLAKLELGEKGLEKITLECKDIRYAHPVSWRYEKSIPLITEGTVIGPEGKYKDVRVFLNGS